MPSSFRNLFRRWPAAYLRTGFSLGIVVVDGEKTGMGIGGGTGTEKPRLMHGVGDSPSCVRHSGQLARRRSERWADGLTIRAGRQ